MALLIVWSDTYQTQALATQSCIQVESSKLELHWKKERERERDAVNLSLTRIDPSQLNLDKYSETLFVWNPGNSYLQLHFDLGTTREQPFGMLFFFSVVLYKERKSLLFSNRDLQLVHLKRKLQKKKRFSCPIAVELLGLSYFILLSGSTFRSPFMPKWLHFIQAPPAPFFFFFLVTSLLLLATSI